MEMRVSGLHHILQTEDRVADDTSIMITAPHIKPFCRIIKHIQTNV